MISISSTCVHTNSFLNTYADTQDIWDVPITSLAHWQKYGEWNNFLIVKLEFVM